MFGPPLLFGTSHPSRVRGLKLTIVVEHLKAVSPSHPSRVRGLKYSLIDIGC